jgi:hypothetical protein
MRYTVLVAVAAFLIGTSVAPRFVKADSNSTEIQVMEVLPGSNTARGRVLGFSCVAESTPHRADCYALIGQ